MSNQQLKKELSMPGFFSLTGNKVTQYRQILKCSLYIAAHFMILNNNILRYKQEQ